MSSLKAIKEKFDRVIIKYTDKSCEVMLVKGLEVYGGLSRCHENDNFDRKLARTIALGRAEHESKVASGEKQPREASSKKYLISNVEFTDGYKYSQTVKFDDVTKLDEFVVDFLPERKSHKAS